jgi:hypothetical protein
MKELISLETQGFNCETPQIFSLKFQNKKLHEVALLLLLNK